MQSLNSKTALGYLLRMPLRLIPRTLKVIVLSGPMRGMRWTVGAAPHGAWLGTLEREKLTHFVGNIRTGMTIWDVGCNVGLYALPSARAIGPEATVYAFEPLERNLNYLRAHIISNGIPNITVVPMAVGAKEGEVRMASGNSPSEFHADPDGPFIVSCTGLDVWREKTGSPPPDVVKIDVEGAETDVLRGGTRTLSDHKPIIYLALHGDVQRRECKELLLDWGYELTSLEFEKNLNLSSEWLAVPSQSHSHKIGCHN